MTARGGRGRPASLLYIEAFDWLKIDFLQRFSHHFLFNLFILCAFFCLLCWLPESSRCPRPWFNIECYVFMCVRDSRARIFSLLLLIVLHALLPKGSNNTNLLHARYPATLPPVSVCLYFCLSFTLSHCSHHRRPGRSVCIDWPWVLWCVGVWWRQCKSKGRLDCMLYWSMFCVCVQTESRLCSTWTACLLMLPFFQWNLKRHYGWPAWHICRPQAGREPRVTPSNPKFLTSLLYLTILDINICLFLWSESAAALIKTC